MSRPKTIEDAFAMIENLQKQLVDLNHQVQVLSDAGSGATALALLSASVETCVQCFQEYKVNGEGHCSYHPGDLVEKRDGRNNYAFTCCGEGCHNWEDGVYVKGCTKARHENMHHKKHPYKFAYYFYLSKQTKLESEEYLEVEVTDPLDTGVKRIRFGNRTDGKLFLVSRDNGKIVFFQSFSEDALQNQKDAQIFHYKNKVVWSPAAPIAPDSNPKTSRWVVGKGYQKGGSNYEILNTKYDSDLHYWLYYVRCDGYDSSYDEWVHGDDLTKPDAPEKKADSKQDHFVEISAKWVLDGTKVKAIECSIKPSDKDTPLTKRIGLNGVNKEGDVITVAEPQSVRKTYTVPPSLESKSPRIPTDGKKEIKAHLSTGDGPLKMEIVAADKIIYLDHDYREKAKGNQYLTDNIRLSNTKGKCAITKVVTNYWVADKSGGKWEPCDATPGQLSEGWRGKELHTNQGLIPLNIDEKLSLDIAFRVHITYHAPKISFQDHIHPSLGEPLRVKYTFTFSDNTTNEIVSEFTSPASVFYDQESFMKDNSCSSKDNMVFFQELDDVNFQRRYRLTCYVNNSQELVLKIAPSNTYRSWTQKDLLYLAGQAAAAGRSEWPIEPVVDKDNNTGEHNVFRQWVLVDTDTLTPYGVKVTGRTSTGFAQVTGLIPWSKIKAN